MKAFAPKYQEPTVEEIVTAVLKDPAFQSAVGPREGATRIAEAAVSAAFVFIGLYAMVEEIQHARAGHA